MAQRQTRQISYRPTPLIDEWLVKEANKNGITTRELLDRVFIAAKAGRIYES